MPDSLMVFTTEQLPYDKLNELVIHLTFDINH